LPNLSYIKWVILMSINIGIIGLPQSGKTTLFNALTGGQADTKTHITEGISSHVGIAQVPEPRLDVLNEMLHPKKVVPVEVKYIDVGASVKTLALEKGVGGELLNQLNVVDTIIVVVRAFTDDSIPHPQGTNDVARDIATLNMELIYSDLAIIERRLHKIDESLKAAGAAERQTITLERDILLHFKADLEEDKAIRELHPEAAASKIIANYQLLTAKPLLIVVNIDEEQLPEATSLEAEINTKYSGEKCRAITLCGKLEMELSQLDEEASRECREAYGLPESGLARTIAISYELSDLISFFTIASNEVRAWSVKKGTTAVKAAGKIHTDMEKGFIRAEGISFDSLVKCGSIAAARKQGQLRLEGKDYIIQDGDVITFLFNV
jgi:GTP-binding protein YchF